MERKLFDKGNFVYLLKNNKLLYDVNVDERKRQIQQLGQISNIMLDAGMIIIAPFANLIEDDIKVLEDMIDFKVVEIISVGDSKKSYLNYNVHMINNK